MKYAVLLSSFLAVCAAQSTSRQKQEVLDEFRYPNGVHPKVPPSNGPKIHAVSPGGKFEFNITNHQSSKNISDIVDALQIAGGFFENALEFTNPIKVEVTYTHGKEGCLTENSNLGIILNIH
ncbi:hypothetical protein DSO57_1002963 [Entomophthora muscae]|uniref:Uncharacterized protein n=1 Tax=Entomophthora muscae TaxID=34485 RepID=A0ACC2U6Z4_9FUNG|nr:hypothetical protein DSO57_1002963 [Entomophthora muscae]